MRSASNTKNKLFKKNESNFKRLYTAPKEKKIMYID